MQYKSTLMVKFIASFLMWGILMTFMGLSTTFATVELQENAMTKTLDWLKANQNEDGSWGKTDTAFLDTSEVAGYLMKNNVLTDNLQKSIAWMENLEILNNDAAARVLPYIKNENKHMALKQLLLNNQNEDGGWGIAQGYASDLLDSVLVLNSLLTEANTDTSVLQKAVDYIVKRQHANGSWSFNNSDEDAVISLTAQTTIALHELEIKTKLTSGELQTAIRKAGEYLLSVRNADQTWGTDSENLINTLLSYRALLNTVGLDTVDTVDTVIFSVRHTDGSWYGSPYLTAQALKAIGERTEIPSAKINSIRLLKKENENQNENKIECYSYYAYNTFEIEVESTYSDTDAQLLYYVKQKDGTVVQVYSKGVPRWDTSNNLPGAYSVIVAVRDNKTGRILTSAEKDFEIVPTAKILEVGVQLDVDATMIDQTVTVNASVMLVNASNIDKQYKIRTAVLDATRAVFHAEKTVEIKAGEQTENFDVLTFPPHVDMVKDYIVKAEVFDGETKVADGQSVFKVLPLPPATRVEAVQTLDKELLYPGKDSVEATIRIKGEGILEPQSAHYNNNQHHNSNNNLHSLMLVPDGIGVYANGSIYNEFIKFIVASGSNNGRFTIGTTGGNPDNPNDNYKRMLFGSSPWSSYTTLKVDGQNYIYDPKTQYPIPNATDLSNTSEDTVENLSVKQIISIVPNTSTKRSDVVQIKYIVKNNDTVNHDVGLRIMLDTMLGNNDCAPFRIPGIGAVTTELELAGENIPQYWQAFDSLITPTVISQGTLLCNPDNRPDKVQFTNWGNVYNNPWLDAVNTGSSNGDSAVSVYWHSKVIVPGETREYVTYYGLSEFQQDLTGTLAVSLTGVNNVIVTEYGYSPNPFTVTTYITNVGRNVADNVKAKIVLPDGLRLINEQQLEKHLGSLESQEEQQVSWDVEIVPSAVERNLTYSVIVTAEGINAKTLSRTVSIPALSDNIAGKNVVFETCILQESMQIDPNRLLPVPAEVIDNPDGSKTLKWKFDEIIIGEEKEINIGYLGTNLVADSTVILTQNSQLTYQDKYDYIITENIPALKIPVNKYLLDSKVVTDKPAYTAKEDVAITNTVKNLTAHPSTLSGKVEIIDRQGSIVKTVAATVTATWGAGESKILEYLWNTGKTMAGTYKARVTWCEGEKVISVAESDFELMADAEISGTVTIDKQKYTANEEVKISEIVKNHSTNSIANNLTVKTGITNTNGELIWSTNNSLPELLPGVQTVVKEFWNTAHNAQGQYTVTLEVYQGTALLSRSNTIFEITAEAEGMMGVSGSLEVLQKNIYPGDAVNFKYTVNNTGNVQLSDVTVRIRIVDTAAEAVLGTITDVTGIDVASDYTAEKTWVHEPFKTGAYLVVLDALLSDGKEVSLGSGYIKVENPYETTIKQVIRPRVLVWAESQGNVKLAKETLEAMQVYYTVVDTREAFMTELRTGKYNLYLLLDSKLPLTGHDDQELAEEIAKGKGLIAAREANGDNLKNLGLFGVKFKGQTTPHDYTVDCLPDSVFGQVTLTGTGKAQNVQLQGGQQLAVLNSKKGASPGVVLNQYQEGKTVLFTFDLGSCAGETLMILQKAVELVTPAPVEETNAAYAELEIKVTGNTTIGAEIKLELPQELEVVWLSPRLSPNLKVWQIDTVTGQEDLFRVLLKLPEAVGQYPVIVDSYYAIENGMWKFTSVEANIIR